MSRPDRFERQWAPIARRLGITRTAWGRAELLSAVERIRWSDARQVPRWIQVKPLGAVAAALLGPRCHGLRRAGRVKLPNGRCLVGLLDASGIRHFVLVQLVPGSDALLIEAVLVLTEHARTFDAPGRAA